MAKHQELHSRLASLPGRVELVQALHEDLSEDVADARPACQLCHRHALAAALQHLRVPRGVGVQQVQQQSPPDSVRNVYQAQSRQGHYGYLRGLCDIKLTTQVAMLAAWRSRPILMVPCSGSHRPCT